MAKTVEECKAILKELEKYKLNDWETKFVADNIERDPKNFSIKQKQIIENMGLKHIQGVEVRKANDAPIRYTNVWAEKEPEGNQVYYYRCPVGPPVTRKEAEIICNWLNEADSSVAEAAKGATSASTEATQEDPF